MKNTILIAALAAAATASAQTLPVLVGGLDFNQGLFPGGIFGSDFNEVSPLRVNGTYSDLTNDASPRMTLWLDGSRGSSDWSSFKAGFNDDSTPNTINAFINTPARTTFGSPVFLSHFNTQDLVTPPELGGNTFIGGNPFSLFLQPGVASQDSFAFAVNTTGYADLTMSFAVRTTSTTATSIAWSYRPNPTAASIPLGVTSSVGTGTFAVQSVDLTAVAGFENQAEAVLIGTMIGVDVDSQLQLDNIQFIATATAIPEPSTWAAIIGGLALGAAALRRRKA